MINRVTRLARKLRGRNLGELRERGGQVLAAWREREGYSPYELAMDDAALRRRLRPGAAADPATLLSEFRMRAQRFMPGFDAPADTLAALAAWCPEDRRDVLARAERAVQGQFDLLGYDGLSYGAPIDWQRDPVRGLRAPEVHWSRVPYLDVSVVGDHKVTWEVNRQQYLVAFGQAYWYTADERWARAFAEHVTAWLDANPPKRGINWASSLEVAFRAMSWLWALQFFRDADALTPALYARLLNALHVHARHLERYLSTYFSPNTHLTGEALGLVHIGALVPELAGADRWLRVGLDVLARWLPRQVRADGGYFEQATLYHRYTTEFALHLLVLDRRHGWGLEPWLRPLLNRLATYLQAVAGEDGAIPLIGDDDGGKFVVLDGRAPDDARGLFAQLGVALESPALAARARESASHSSALWLFGDGATRILGAAESAPRASQAFTDTGVFVMRDGGERGAGHAVVDCGPHGAFNAGHAHADLLSVILAEGDRPLLVDSGTYTYSGPERNEFRGAAAHNVLLVDGHGSSEPSPEAFQWRTKVDGRLLDWRATDAFTYVEGEHDGFAQQLADVGVHRRAVLLIPGLGWIVRDRLDARGTHDVRAHWHAASGLTVEVDPNAGGAVLADRAGRPVLRVAAFGEGAFTSEPAWVSPRYGARVPATRLVYAQRADGAHEIITLLLPARATASALPTVREIAVRGSARSLVIDGPDGPRAVVGIGADAGWGTDLAAALGDAGRELAISVGDIRVVRPARSR